MSTHEKLKYFVAIPVWGKEYVNTFLQSSLPTLMAVGNLPFLIANSAVQICIYTSKNDVELIFSHPLIQYLQTQGALELHVLELPRASHYENLHYYRQAIYALKSNAYKDNIHRANTCKNYTSVAVSLNADIVFSDHFFTEAHKILQTGKRVIEVVGPRGKACEISEALNQNYLNPKDGIINVSATKLLDIWLKHIHPLLSIHNWEGNSEIFNASHLMWPVDNSGWLARCFYLYPIMTVIPKHTFNFEGTIDQDLVQNCGYDINDAHVVTNNADMFCCELSDNDKFVGHSGKRGDLASISRRYVEYGNKYNFQLLQHRILLGHGFNQQQLTKVIERSDIVVNKLTNNVQSRFNIQKTLHSIGRSIRNYLYEDSQLGKSLGKTK